MSTVNPQQTVTYDLRTSDNPIYFSAATNLNVSNYGSAVYGETGTAWSVTNAGMIVDEDFGTGSGTGFGIHLASGGALDNLDGGKVEGAAYGVNIANGAGVVQNYGSISAGFFYGGAGVALQAGGSVTNGSSASISGNMDGVQISGGSASLTNQGSIQGLTGVDIVAADATIKNTATGKITSSGVPSIAEGGAAVDVVGSGANIYNAGDIENDVPDIHMESQPRGIAVTLKGGGVVTNKGQITQQGSLDGIGVYMDLTSGAGAIVNASGASISGDSAYGIFITGNSSQTATVTNAGAISGEAYSIVFDSLGANTLILQSGATLSGRVRAAASGANTLELQGAGATGAPFIGFSHIQADAGAAWTLSDPFTLDADLILDGSLSIAGGLGSSFHIDEGAGTLTLDGFSSAWDAVNSDDVSLALDGARASISGGGDSISAIGTSASQISLYDTTSAWDGVTAAGSTLYLTDAQASVMGGGNAIYLRDASAMVSLYDTDGDWDGVSGSDDVVYLTDAQASVSGGNLSIVFGVGSANAVSLYGTKGAWDAVTGDEVVVNLDDAQASVFGGGDTVYFLGKTGNQVSLYNTDNNWDSVSGSGGLIYLTNAQASVTGSLDTIDFSAGSSNAVSLYATQGVWDTINGANGVVYLTSAQTSVIGAGNQIYFSGGSGNAVSLAGTGGDWDYVAGSRGAVDVYGARTTVAGSDDVVSLFDSSQATLNGGSNTAAFAKGIGGQDFVYDFGPSDLMQFSASDFANFAALSTHISPSGGNAVITLNPSDSVTLVGVAASSLTASEFRFD